MELFHSIKIKTPIDRYKTIISNRFDHLRKCVPYSIWFFFFITEQTANPTVRSGSSNQYELVWTTTTVHIVQIIGVELHYELREKVKIKYIWHKIRYGTSNTRYGLVFEKHVLHAYLNVLYSRILFCSPSTLRLFKFIYSTFSLYIHALRMLIWYGLW